jgi:ABC-type cobalamin/Fe3+-siderophores transport system ATPase subunit
LKRQGITLLVATHDLNQAAEQYPKILLLNRRVIAYGAPEAVLTAEALGRAYGSQIHVVHTAGRELLIADSCCDEGHAPVEPILTVPTAPHAAQHVDDAPPAPERMR